MTIDKITAIRNILNTAKSTLQDWNSIVPAIFPLELLDDDGSITTIENVGKELDLYVEENSENDTDITLGIHTRLPLNVWVTPNTFN